MTKRKIIVAVLNWGLGHASRSIPIVYALLEDGFDPVLASDGESLLLLRKEFPKLEWFELPSYHITYPRQGRFMKIHFILKGPLMLKAIFAEYNAIRSFISSDGSVAGIISDNRLGCFSKKVPSAYVTHQLQLLSGSTSKITSRVHHFFIERYSECWVPDTKEPGNLTGEISVSKMYNIPVKYVGPLSRFMKRKADKSYDLLVLLSGPEPQRRLLEEILLMELKGYEGRILFIRGKVDAESTVEEKGKMTILNYLTGTPLELAINTAGLVLARSGYSTIMDLAVLGKKAFFIPTPGQFEQEYLANRLQSQKIAPFCAQERFSLKELEKTKSFTGFTAIPRSGSLAGVLALFHGK